MWLSRNRIRAFRPHRLRAGWRKSELMRSTARYLRVDPDRVGVYESFLRCGFNEMRGRAKFGKGGCGRIGHCEFSGPVKLPPLVYAP